MAEITISSEEFKALSSETRTEIIKLLKQRNYTLSEIAKKLGLATSTVKQHLDVLSNTDLIKQKDEGRKWKYYSLTRKGSEIFAPRDTTSILITLGVGIFAVVILMYSFTGLFMVQGLSMPFAAEAGADGVLGKAEMGVPDAVAAAGEDALAGADADAGVGAGDDAADEERAVSAGIAQTENASSVIIYLLLIAIVSAVVGFQAARLKSGK